MKVFSPEIVLIVQGQAIRSAEASINMCVKGKSILAYRDFNPQRVNERFISELGRTTAYRNRSSVTIQQKGSTEYGGVVVGLIHSRGVGRVMPVEF